MELAPSFIAVEKAMREKEADGEYIRASTTMSLNEILGNTIALEFFKSFCREVGCDKSLLFVLDVAWLSLLEEKHDRGTRHGSSTSTLEYTDIGAASHSQIVRLSQTIFATYIQSFDKDTSPILLDQATVRKIAASEVNGKFKYKPGLFKSAASSVRKALETTVLPEFRRSATFRAMYLLLLHTSQIAPTGTRDDAIELYSSPAIRSSALPEDGKRVPLLERLRPAVVDEAALDKLLSKAISRKDSQRALSVGDLPKDCRRQSIFDKFYSRTEEDTLSEPKEEKVRRLAPSPFSVLLPGGKSSTRKLP